MAKRDDFIDREPGTSDFGLIVRLVTPTTAVPVSGTVSTVGTAISTATKSNVVSAAVDTLLLSSNTNRRGAFIYNDTDKILYVSFGAVAASTTSYTVQLPVAGTLILDDRHTYEIRGIWATGPTGSARITELT